jgi:hypothetical protein
MRPARVALGAGAFLRLQIGQDPQHFSRIAWNFHSKSVYELDSVLRVNNERGPLSYAFPFVQDPQLAAEFPLGIRQQRKRIVSELGRSS